MLAVILAAINDAIGQSALCEAPNLKALNAQRARTWFDRAGFDFHMVCHAADLHPANVRDAALAYIDSQTESAVTKAERIAAIPGLTVAALAKRSGVAASTVQNILTGTGRSRHRSRAKVEAALAELSQGIAA